MSYVYSVPVHRTRDAMIIQIDLSSTAPAYRQIVDQLRVLIVDQSLAAGTSLPPVRTLARELDVHHNTVAEAYRTLAADGLVEIAHGRGATVMGRKKSAERESQEESLAAMRRRLEQMVAEFRAQGLSRRRIVKELRGLTEALDI